MNTLKQAFTALESRRLPNETAQRITGLLGEHRQRYSLPLEEPCAVFSAPGRIELAGNHTDHNGGTVLASAVDMDVLAAVSPGTEGEAVLHSDLYPELFRMDVGDGEVKEEEKGTPRALIRGVIQGFRNRGVEVGGMRISLLSRVAPGSGLSSSAAFEVLLGGICNDLFAQGSLSCVDLAIIGQEAENRYFGKPCGLMDQAVCSCGGTLLIDFKDPEPRMEMIPFSFSEWGYSLYVIQTGSSHEDLSEDYTRVRMDMEACARLFGARRLRDLSREDLLRRYADLSEEPGGRPLLRAFHFFDEQDRVQRLARALKEKNLPVVLRELRGSGISSALYLQNCHTDGNTADRGILLAYYLSERFFTDHQLNAAVRVHGGGFAGTVLACVPQGAAQEFQDWMGEYFGASSVIPLAVRQEGVVRLL
ncbi:MAG: galactokinase [Spirochaetales bacterium]|nr:galactokinase [Spirochaetales bacterium]